MFLREIKTKGKAYLTIVESYWKEGKSKHRIIGNLGRVDKLRNSEQLRKIAESLLKYCSENKRYYNISTAEERSRKRWGVVAIYRKIWERFGLDELLSRIIEGSRIRFDFFSTVFLMVLDRVCEPKSKLKSYEKQNKYHDTVNNSLQHLYRALDVLERKKEEIEENLFNANKNLFNMKVDVVFYDITTIYFESVESDGLREFGFSKDCKINEVQILLGLLVDREGRPVGFDVFEGNKFEGRTVEETIKKLKKRFRIGKLVFVGDKGILNKENIRQIKEAEYEYIIGMRIKNVAERIKEKIFDERGYINVSTKKEGEVFKYKEIEIDDEDKMIVSYSKLRAKKDEADRERLIEKARKLIEKGGEIISKRGAMKYIEIEHQKEVKLREEKISEDEKWDGYYGVQTNNKLIKPEEILDNYHYLWKIEESFRIFKSHLEVRPVFHWTPRRIKGHMLLCFIAFLLERTLEIELKNGNIEYSTEQIREALLSLEFSEIEVEGQIFYLRSPVEGLANDILRLLKIRIPPKITTAELF